MLDETLTQQLQAYLGRLSEPVEIAASLDDSDAAREMRELLQQIASLSPLITFVEREDEQARKPSFAVRRQGSDMRLRFAGIPLGHEFTSLVLALLQAGGHPPKVDAALIEQVRALGQTESGATELNFEIYISLSCQNCPDVVQALNLMAVLNPRVSSTMIDGALFQQEVEARQIMAVPSVYLNGEPFGQGRMTLEEILAKLDSSVAQRQAERLQSKAPFDVLVVGG